MTIPSRALPSVGWALGIVLLLPVEVGVGEDFLVVGVGEDFLVMGVGEDFLVVGVGEDFLVAAAPDFCVITPGIKTPKSKKKSRREICDMAQIVLAIQQKK